MIGKRALNLNLAEVRGGDQAVVKENDEQKTLFSLVGEQLAVGTDSTRHTL